ncbi:MAG: N-acetylmuramic acid 6-phosphate etherase, partial [Planctomycetales bacterium]|nr:N-acetylmuramic acid 6-phosphate etherase [Planctomycetales bacterium]
LVLNSITTATMIRLGKTYGNLMVDLRATNSKLRDRSRRIVRTLAGVTDDQAAALLDACDGEVKTAIVSHVNGVDAEVARRCLDQVGGHLRNAIEAAK